MPQGCCWICGEFDGWAALGALGRTCTRARPSPDGCGVVVVGGNKPWQAAGGKAGLSLFEAENPFLSMQVIIALAENLDSSKSQTTTKQIKAEFVQDPTAFAKITTKWLEGRLEVKFVDSCGWKRKPLV